MMIRIPILAAALAGLPVSGAPAAGDPQATRALLAALNTGTNLHDRARACQQLGAQGTAEAVPHLAALLADPLIAAYARQGLEGIPGPAPAAALRAALAPLKGDLLLGAIDSLGSLRDSKAVPDLARIAGGTDIRTARAAMQALGRIATAEAVAVLRPMLAAGPEDVRMAAAAACLLAADEWVRGRCAPAGDAIALFDAVRAANISPGLRAAATRGALAARGPAAAPLFTELAESTDLHIRNAALLAVREIPGDALADALRAAFGAADPALRVQIVEAMLDCRNDRTLPAVRVAAADEAPPVRLAALRILAKAGTTADDAAVLAAALARDGTADEHAVASDGLVRIAGADVDALVLKTLVSASGADARARLISILGARGGPGTAGELLRQAADPEARVAVAAHRALKAVAGPAELPALLTLTRTASNASVRAAAEGAVHGVCTRNEGAAAAVLPALTGAVTAADRCSWIRILASLGYGPALPALCVAAAGTDETVAVCALEQLGRWPEPSPMTNLLAAVEADAAPRRRAAAFTSAAQLAGATAADGRESDVVLSAWFRRLGNAARSVEEKRLVLAGLGRFAGAEGLRLLTPYLDDPALNVEAAWAVVNLSAMMEAPADLGALRDALRKVADGKAGGDVRGKASSRLRNLPEPPASVPLFDGRTLDGWEGGTNVWRVRDGVIVGGSMDGNPRNEFLAAVRPFTNFVLNLEYRIAGTEGFVNGGVQFRSARTAKPPNEMRGYQADIGAGHSGCLYDESRRNRFLARATDEQIRRLEKPGEWNRLEVRCEGRRIRISLNGERTVDVTETDDSIPGDGLIALQIHGNCKAEISFRNLSISVQP